MDPTDRSTDRIARLLTALVVLASVLVVGLAVGGVLLWRGYARLRDAAFPDGAREAAVEVSRKQAEASAELARVARDASRQIAGFERRAEELRARGREGGAIDEAKRAVEMTQLMADELLMQLKLMTALEGSFEKLARPLPAQRELAGASKDAAPAEARERGGDAPPRAARHGARNERRR